MNKHPNIPRRKRATRNARLRYARQWLAAIKKDKTFPGKKAVRRYAKWFGVDLLCAIIELRLLGVTVDETYEQLVKKSINDRLEAKRRKKDEDDIPFDPGDRDENQGIDDDLPF